MREPVYRRLLATVVALAAGAAFATPGALAAVVTLHVSGHSRLAVGANTLGVPFFFGVYGETPLVYGTVTNGGPVVPNASVDLQYREARNYASAPWKTVCQAVTDANGSFFVKAADCVSSGFKPWHPRRTGGLRAVVTDLNASSKTIGWIVVPDIHITASKRSASSAGSSTYSIGGRLVAAPAAKGTLMLTRVGASTALAHARVRGGKAFQLALTLTHSGTEHLRLEFVPHGTAPESEPVSRDLALQVSVQVRVSSRTTTVVAKPAIHPRVPKASLAASLPDIPL